MSSVWRLSAAMANCRTFLLINTIIWTCVSATWQKLFSRLCVVEWLSYLLRQAWLVPRYCGILEYWEILKVNSIQTHSSPQHWPPHIAFLLTWSIVHTCTRRLLPPLRLSFAVSCTQVMQANRGGSAGRHSSLWWIKFHMLRLRLYFFQARPEINAVNLSRSAGGLPAFHTNVLPPHWNQPEKKTKLNSVKHTWPTKKSKGLCTSLGCRRHY